MNEDHHRAAVEAAYGRLRETLEAKDVSVESLRVAALEALDHARIEVELDQDWVAGELTRLKENTPPAVPQAAGAAGSKPDVK